MKVIVTGGCGFIGSNLVDRLVKEGHGVNVIDNESSDAHDQFFYNDVARYHKVDISDYDSIKHIFQNAHCVFHLAAESRIMNTIENPTLAVQTNVLGTANVLQAAKENNVKRVVYSSTSAAYGLKNEIPNTETMTTDCLNPYSVSKCAGEDLCSLYTEMYDLETVTFRYFNVYGNRQPSKGPYAPVMGIFKRQFDSRQDITIVGDGMQKRDYVNVDDVVDANIKAAFSTDPRVINQIFNIGSEKNYSVLDLADMITQGENEYKHLPARPGEARETLADCTKAKELLGWSAKVNLKEWLETNR